MDRRINDEDDDVLRSFTTTTTTYAFAATDSNRPSIYFAPSPPRRSSEEEHDAITKFSLEDVNISQKAPPKIFDRFYDTSSSEEDNDFVTQNDAVQKRLDYMIQYLDRKLSDSLIRDNVNGKVSGNGSNSQRVKAGALEEFVGRGGGAGIFKLPVRAVVHPGRPPSLELRPHPLRETQVGCFLRTIDCVNDGDGNQAQLWAGSECGLKVWDLRNMYSAAAEEYKEVEDTAPFCESLTTSPTLCVVGDAGNRVVWSGHKDGKIRCWKMQNVGGNCFREGLSWQAHRAPVLSMVITSYGDLWTGSEGGSIKIWPWDVIEKALSLTMEERHMSGLLIERSYIDLGSQVVLNGASCGIFASDIKYMLSDRTGARVWSSSYLSFALWDARTKDLLKMFNVDGQIENMSAIQEPVIEDEMRVRVASVSKKEKSQSSISFFQRSRNAIIGAADAVRRAATKGTLGDDNRRTEALVATVNGMIWTGCANGLLVLWDGNGNRLQDFQYHNSSIQCLCTYGSRTWVGYASGVVQIVDLNGNVMGEWVAHNSPVIDFSIGSGYIFTLANHGGIRGWNITSPGPLDGIMRSELAEKDFLYTRLENLKILAGTWNVGQGRATHDSLISWLGSAAADVGIVVVGLQEVEMGAGFLAMSAAKETMQLGLDGSSVGQWWLEMIGRTLDEGSTFERLGSRQLAGLLIAVWVRNDILSHVGDVDVAAVPCGFGRAIGNKGAVGLRMRVYGRIMCFVNCHFAAHLEAVGRRNADFDYVYRTMAFSRLSNLFNSAAASGSSGVQMLRGANSMGVNPVGGIPELSEADMVVFLGDLNYRLDGISYDEARDFISQRSFDWLRERDQLRAEMEAGNAFQGMREAVIRFPPTYKFERHQAGLAGYDSGEKKRIPAWCDRILYRDSRSAPVSSCSLECPVVSSVLQYEACMDVTESDHKPVRCIFGVEIARVDESVRRQEFGEIVRSNEKIRHMLAERCKIPEAIVSTNNIILQNQDVSILRITNKDGKDRAWFEIICEGQSTIGDDGQAHDHHPRGSFGFPRWLEVSPASGIMKPDQIVEVSVRHEEYQTLEEFVDGVPQNCWCEDARDKEVILIAKVHGCYTTEAKSHRIRVRYSLCGKTPPKEQKIEGSNNFPANLLRRSDFQRLSCSSDVVDQLRHLHSP